MNSMDYPELPKKIPNYGSKSNKSCKIKIAQLTKGIAMVSRSVCGVPCEYVLCCANSQGRTCFICVSVSDDGSELLQQSRGVCGCCSSLLERWLLEMFLFAGSRGGVRHLRILSLPVPERRPTPSLSLICYLNTATARFQRCSAKGEKPTRL
jgi:hypothetical protein